jgi:two-component system LytT family response regulator
MILKCVAIDDEPLALQLTANFISRIPGLQLERSFDDAVAGAAFLKTNKTDLLFLDINMPDISGIELIRSLAERPMIIFITAHKDFALEGFELDAIDYLLKPVSFDRFSKAVNKALEYFRYKKSSTREETDSLFVHSEYRLVRIPLNSIEFIESMEDYIRIYVDEGRPVLTLMPLKAVLEKLPADQFRRIHRSYIVSVKKVKAVQNKKLQMHSSKELPISKSYRDFVEEWKQGK